MTCITVFVCNFLMIFLLGTQTLHVTNHRCVWAATTSMALGLCGWTVTAIIAQHKDAALGSPVFLAYWIAGPVGSVCAMKATRWLR